MSPFVGKDWLRGICNIRLETIVAVARFLGDDVSSDFTGFLNGWGHVNSNLRPGPALDFLDAFNVVCVCVYVCVVAKAGR